MTKIVNLEDYKRIIIINGLNTNTINISKETLSGKYRLDIGFDIQKFFDIDKFNNIGGSTPVFSYNFKIIASLYLNECPYTIKYKPELIDVLLKDFYCSKLKKIFKRKDILFVTSEKYLNKSFIESIKDNDESLINNKELKHLKSPGVLFEIIGNSIRTIDGLLYDNYYTDLGNGNLKCGILSSLGRLDNTFSSLIDLPKTINYDLYDNIMFYINLYYCLYDIKDFNALNNKRIKYKLIIKKLNSSIVYNYNYRKEEYKAIKSKYNSINNKLELLFDNKDLNFDTIKEEVDELRNKQRELKSKYDNIQLEYNCFVDNQLKLKLKLKKYNSKLEKIILELNNFL